MIAAATGLPAVTSDGSAGGYKDWFLKNGFGFSITAELGDDYLCTRFRAITRRNLRKSLKTRRKSLQKSVKKYG